MSKVTELRDDLFGKKSIMGDIQNYTAFYEQMVNQYNADKAEDDHQDFAGIIAERIIPITEHNSPEQATAQRQKRRKIFEYIADFMYESTFKATSILPIDPDETMLPPDTQAEKIPDTRSAQEKYHDAFIGKGLNLALYPFLAPTGYVVIDETTGAYRSAIEHMADTSESNEGRQGNFRFQEQYRWDTYFQNKFLILIGAYEMARNQLLNLVEVFDFYQRIPNALTTEFLSHPQPPFEAIGAQELKDAWVNCPDDRWYDRVMQTAEKDLFVEWFDHGTGRIHPRQDHEFYSEDEKNLKRFLTRYVSVHFHSLLVGCQDGKDHHWLTAAYGEEYLSVQLHSLIYQTTSLLYDYYNRKCTTYEELADEPTTDATTYYETYKKHREAHRLIGDSIKVRMLQLMLVHPGRKVDFDSKRYRGFKNYSIRDEQPIPYGDLSAEIFPLFAGIPDATQGLQTLKTLKEYYQGNIGLASTSPLLRLGSPLASAPPGWEGNQSQWEINTWPPLMIIAVEGLQRQAQSDPEHAKKYEKFAIKVQQRWVRYIEAYFEKYQHFKEKSPYDSKVPLSKGYYSNLPGFGWTIAAYGLFVHNLAKAGCLDDKSFDKHTTSID